MVKGEESESRIQTFSPLKRGNFHREILLFVLRFGFKFIQVVRVQRREEECEGKAEFRREIKMSEMRREREKMEKA